MSPRGATMNAGASSDGSPNAWFRCGKPRSRFEAGRRRAAVVPCMHAARQGIGNVSPRTLAPSEVGVKRRPNATRDPTQRHGDGSLSSADGSSGMSSRSSVFRCRLSSRHLAGASSRSVAANRQHDSGVVSWSMQARMYSFCAAIRLRGTPSPVRYGFLAAWHPRRKPVSHDASKYLTACGRSPSVTPARGRPSEAKYAGPRSKQ